MGSVGLGLFARLLLPLIPFFTGFLLLLSTHPPMHTLRFELRQSAGSGSYQHLALFAAQAPVGTAPLAHWVLPHELRRIEPLAEVLLTEAPSGLVLPTRLLDGGTGLLPTASLPLARSLNHVPLTLRGVHLNGHYSLQRLQPGGTSWLLGPTYSPPERRWQQRFLPSSTPLLDSINRNYSCGYPQF